MSSRHDITQRRVVDWDAFALGKCALLRQLLPYLERQLGCFVLQGRVDLGEYVRAACVEGYDDYLSVLSALTLMLSSSTKTGDWRWVSQGRVAQSLEQLSKTQVGGSEWRHGCFAVWQQLGAIMREHEQQEPLWRSDFMKDPFVCQDYANSDVVAFGEVIHGTGVRILCDLFYVVTGRSLCADNEGRTPSRRVVFTTDDLFLLQDERIAWVESSPRFATRAVRGGYVSGVLPVRVFTGVPEL